MAFDHEDTDDWFDHNLTPVLRALDIQVRRVDRIEHNDDIDDRIIAEIRAADFVIADLTYARPSVYYEAGFAQREIPVIYTSRADHFRPGPEHPELRVHFDLTMRNIIPWSNSRDRAFSTRLRSRVRSVIAPLLRERAATSLAREQEGAFTRLSLANKRSAVIDGAVRKLASLTGIRSFERNATGFNGSRLVGTTLWGVQCEWDEGFTAAQIRQSMYGDMDRPQFNLQPRRSEDRIDQVRDLYLFLSLRSVPWSRISSSLSILDPVDPATKHLRYRREEEWPTGRVGTFTSLTLRPGYDGQFFGQRRTGTPTVLQVGRDAIPMESPVARTLDVAFVDRIKSTESMSTRIDALVAKWREEGTA